MPPIASRRTTRRSLSAAKRLRSVCCLCAGLVLAATPALGQGSPTPVADEIQVNTYTTSIQGKPNVAIDTEGASVVVWHSLGSPGTDSSSFSIQAQRYDADGSAAGGQFQVNSYTTNLQINPAVAMRDDGQFLVVWESLESSTGDNDNGIHGQRYAANGTPIGGQFQVNSYTTGNQSNPVASFDSTGAFVVTWESFMASPGDDTDAGSILARRFDAAGNGLGGDFQVNSYTTNTQLLPDIAHTPTGDFIVAWTGFGSTGDDTSAASIAARRFANDGTPHAGQFQVNTLTTFYQATVTLDTDAGGNFVLTWQSFATTGTDGDTDTSIQARRFQADGDGIGGDFQVNTTTTDYQRPSAVAVQSDGSFLVAWQSESSAGTDSDLDSIQLQWFFPDGTFRGDELQVNTYTTGEQEEPDIALAPNGDLVIVWEGTGSPGTDTDAGSIHLRRYQTHLFLDGFESGDTSAWSNAVP